MCMWFVLYVVCTVNIDLYGADQTASYGHNDQDWMCLALHSVQSNEEEGYVLPTSARKVSCQHFY